MKAVTAGPEFDLFISYVRRDVRQTVGGRSFDVVARLKRELERHRRPSSVGGREKKFRVCTDVDDFELDDTFDSVITDRIAHSRGFLLICTSGARDSHYVRRELAIHRQLQRGDKPLSAVLSARPAEVAPDFFASEQVAADLAPPEHVTQREWCSLLRRESHKIVARIWGLRVREVYDRFEADRRALRLQIVYASVILTLFIGGLVVGLKGEDGIHRVAVLPISEKLVAPAGVAFASDGKTPVVLEGDKALVWSNGINQPPVILRLPFPALHASAFGPGEVAVADLRDVAIVLIPTMEVRMRTIVGSQIEAIAAQGDWLAVSTENGSLFFVDKHGRIEEAPRPISTGGRRFRAFREKGPFEYGSLLALDDGRYLATATLTGRLGLLDRSLNAFVVAREPQYPLALPIEAGPEPILYETENTRPIGALAFLSDSTLLFAEGDGLRRVDTTTGRITSLAHCPLELVRQILPTVDGRGFTALTSSTLEVLQFEGEQSNRLQCRQRTTLAPKFAPTAALAADHETLLIAFFDGEPELWQPTFRLWGLDLRIHTRRW